MNPDSSNTERPFHSHTYAKTASGVSMGASSAQTFGQRYHINQNRRLVSNYRNSYVATGGHLREELSRRINEDGHSIMPIRREPTTRQGFNATIASAPSKGQKRLQVPKRGFTEPPTRYNPYA